MMPAAPIILAAMAQMAAPFGQPSMPTDPRIQLVFYSPDQVVPLRVSDGFATVVELSSDERIENIVVGNSTGWQVTPNRTGNRLVIKSLGGAALTNLIVLTDVRRYVFLISVDTSGSGAFAMRFIYADRASEGIVRTVAAAEYRLRGDKTLFPLSMSDDGHRTTITWDRQASLPAIFAVDDRRREALINGRMVDGDYVIEGTARRYIFRIGDRQAVATRKSIKAK